MVVYFDEKDDDLYLRLRAMSHTVYAAIFEQIITQHVFLMFTILSKIDYNLYLDVYLFTS
jgi:hypothetical protein